ncbi:MAG: Indolepyruvate oxidoreductase subunit IorB [Promethearchaeota archaeon]|nr:MAG: Indolepyruvate oxidoreductase subunit IorB [Candidatus Lokiarchaeota archaeon]
MHGLAQREGAITSHTRYQKKIFNDPRKDLQSPLISYGDADLYICLEPVEALRRGIFASNKTSFAVNSHTIPGVMITAKLEEYPELGQIESTLKTYSDDVYFMDATKLSLDHFNQNQQMNLIMLGFAIVLGKIPYIAIKNYEAMIREHLSNPDINIEALDLGIQEGRKLIKKK